MKPSASVPHAHFRTFVIPLFRLLTRGSASRHDRPGKRRCEANKVVPIAIAALLVGSRTTSEQSRGTSTDYCVCGTIHSRRTIPSESCEPPWATVWSKASRTEEMSTFSRAQGRVEMTSNGPQKEIYEAGTLDKDRSDDTRNNIRGR